MASLFGGGRGGGRTGGQHENYITQYSELSLKRLDLIMVLSCTCNFKLPHTNAYHIGMS